MEKKYFFFDIDNTLVVWPGGYIPESALFALKKLREAGHFVALATGRLQADAARHAKIADICDFVADGGYSVTIGNQVVYMEGLPLETSKKLIHQLEDIGIRWAVTLTNELVRHTRFSDVEDTFVIWDHFTTIVDPTLDIDSFTQIYKIYLYLGEGDREKLAKFDHLNMPFIYYGDSCILYEPMDKAKGIKKVMDFYEADYKNVVVFGDGRNDRTMFLPEWYNIAMGNARPELKELADYITTNCDEDGIFNACIAHGWISE